MNHHTTPTPPLAPDLDPSAAPAAVRPRDQLVRELAYELYERRGRVPGRDLEDWVAAEAIVDARLVALEQMQAMAASAPGAAPPVGGDEAPLSTTPTVAAAAAQAPASAAVKARARAPAASPAKAPAKAPAKPSAKAPAKTAAKAPAKVAAKAAKATKAASKPSSTALPKPATPPATPSGDAPGVAAADRPAATPRKRKSPG